MTSCDPDNLSSDKADNSFDYVFKIVVVGDCGTGKTCIVQRFSTGNFVENTGETIRSDHLMKVVTVDNKKVKLQIWDTAGSERFRSLTQKSYRFANAVILVYDITQRSSFERLQEWIEEIRRYTLMDFTLIVLGNKCDLESRREVSKSEAEAVCEYFPELFRMLETSAKEDNLDTIFHCLASELKTQKPKSTQVLADNSFDYSFTIVVVGDSGTGKTCIVQKFHTGNFFESSITIGVDYATKIVTVDDQKIQLRIWDTAGKERFRSLTQNYYRYANAVILVYDITQRSSFGSLKSWIEEIRRNTPMNFALVVLGNKYDLKSRREVSESEVEAACEYFPELFCMLETSAKENNLDTIFYCLASELKRRYEDGQFSESAQKKYIIELEKKRNLSSCSFCFYKSSRKTL